MKLILLYYTSREEYQSALEVCPFNAPNKEIAIEQLKAMWLKWNTDFKNYYHNNIKTVWPQSNIKFHGLKIKLENIGYEHPQFEILTLDEWWNQNEPKD